MINQYPIFIICRDRVNCLSQLVDWLEKAGQERIYLMDNDSTYEPLLEYYKKSPHNVIYNGGNLGQNGLWLHGILDKYTNNEPFVVSDPDVIPIEECPWYALDHFKRVLNDYPDRTKVGFGLKIDDLPDTYRFKQNVIEYESKFSAYGGPEPGLYYAPIDTTFALYRAGASSDISYSCRTGAPYLARHLSWYIDSSNVPIEEQYYIDHCHRRINSWNHLDLPFWLGGNV